MQDTVFTTTDGYKLYFIDGRWVDSKDADSVDMSFDCGGSDMRPLGQDGELLDGELSIEINLDHETVGDAADLIPGYMAESYWIGLIEPELMRVTCSIIADVYSTWGPDQGLGQDEYGDDIWKGAKVPALTHWFFGTNFHTVLPASEMLESLGLKSVDQIKVFITLEDGSVFRVPYRTQAVPGFSASPVQVQAKTYTLTLTHDELVALTDAADAMAENDHCNANDVSELDEKAKFRAKAELLDLLVVTFRNRIQEG